MKQMKKMSLEDVKVLEIYRAKSFIIEATFWNRLKFLFKKGCTFKSLKVYVIELGWMEK